VVVAREVGLTSSLAALVALLALLGAIAGLTLAGWVAGLGCGVTLVAMVARGLARSRAEALGPGDLVTLLRATLACAVAALVAQSFVAQPATAVLVGISVSALVLDAVDGPVARRTGTGSAFGARFDGEADAFLILVLSVEVSRSFGAWVLVMGAARYGFGLAGWILPWLRAPLPFRFWRKVVTAVVGVTLVLAAADVAPRAPMLVALLVALTLLAESFGRDVVWLRHHRTVESPVGGASRRIRSGA
jgi:phosphatidylglycerophosphate synthase